MTLGAKRSKLRSLVVPLAIAPILIVACSSSNGDQPSAGDAGTPPSDANDAAKSADGTVPVGDAGRDASYDASVDVNPADGSVDVTIDAEAAPPVPTCSELGLACVAPPPAGWALVGLYAGASALPPPSCEPGIVSAAGTTDIIADPATCPPCSVGAPISPGTCAASYNIYDEACVRFPHGSVPVNGCTSFSTVDTVVVTPGRAVGASCPMPTQDDPAAMPVAAPVRWATTAVTCELSANATCDAGKVCARPPGEGFRADACIFHAGDVPCPDGFDYAVDFEQVASDSRTCTCGSAFKGSCDLRRYGDSSCAGASSLALGCLSNGGFALSGYFGFSSPTPVNPSCTVTNDTSGSVTTAVTRTVCCPTPP